MNENPGKWLIIFGLIVVLAGVIIWLMGDHLSWLGHLPGDIRIESDKVRFYFPVTTMIIISVMLSLLIALLSRFFGK